MEIILDNLVKTYKGINNSCDVNAVKGISLNIPSNQIYGIIGKSGAGKSTLVRLISLLETPDSGSVIYNDKRVDNLVGKDLLLQRRRLGMIFQNFNLFSSRTAGQNIAYPLEICGYSKNQIDVRVDEMLELVGLSDKKNAPISTLSGGQKQRIAIARALSTKPDVLFCDEATSALDPQTTKSILNLIRQIQEQMNLTVVMITHQMEVVRDACNLVAVLNDGEVVEQGAVGGKIGRHAHHDGDDHRCAQHRDAVFGEKSVHTDASPAKRSTPNSRSICPRRCRGRPMTLK